MPYRVIRDRPAEMSFAATVRQLSLARITHTDSLLEAYSHAAGLTMFDSDLAVRLVPVRVLRYTPSLREEGWQVA